MKIILLATLLSQMLSGCAIINTAKCVSTIFLLC